MTNLIVRIDLGTHGRLGPGKLMLLQKVEQLGSISAAGRAMNMSYRQAWGLIDQLNHAFLEPVVISQTGGRSGGGAQLTDFGKLLLTHCGAIIANAKKTSQPHLEFIEAVLNPKPPADGLDHSQPSPKPAPAKRASNAPGRPK